MLIESIIKRPGGTTITLEGKTYKFKPKDESENAPHVCEVENKKHAGRLLSITEGYRLHDPDQADEDEGSQGPAPWENGGNPPLGSDDDGGTHDNAGSGEPDDTNPENGAAVLMNMDVEKASEAQMRDFVTKHFGIKNPDDKEEVVDFAQEMYKVQLAKQAKPETLLRNLLGVAKNKLMEKGSK